ncbi:DNA topoisomerase [Cupriavidus sp. CP313]
MRIERLWIPEKPSVGKDIVQALVRTKRARVLNARSAAADGYFALDSGDVICPLFGHMLTMLPPAAYLTKEQNAGNYFDFLPLVPQPFKYEPKPDVDEKGKAHPPKRFNLVGELSKKAGQIVNACDIDREGQLIFDEMFLYWGLDPAGSRFLRAKITSKAETDLDRSVTTLEKNGSEHWVRQRMAAIARQVMDWLLGMNGSMAYQQLTGVKTMSVGRVQSPVLAMVVLRDLAIQTFKPQTYFVPVVTLADGTTLRWEKRKDAAGTAGFDAAGRLIDKALATGLVGAIKAGARGSVAVASTTVERENPPLPFSMGRLQATASKQHGLSIEQVTKAAQNLYEKHKAITYVGTDCEYLPTAMHADAGKVIEQLASVFSGPCAKANPARKSRAFNDEKVDEHFAIIPTGTLPALSDAEYAERAVYETVVRRYLAQFYPAYEYQKTSLVVMFGPDEFRASARRDLVLGWRELERPDANEAEAEAPIGSRELPKLEVGQQIVSSGVTLETGQTKPPSRYDEASLMDDMISAYKFAKTDRDRELLKDTQGIGTSRTRGPIIANLLKRGFLLSTKKGKRHEITSTPFGKETIGRLPPWLTDVTTTAKWELMLSAIARGEADMQSVIESQVQYVKTVIERARMQLAPQRFAANEKGAGPAKRAA